MSATSSSANGINNAGTMIVTNKIYGNGYATGIHNKSTGKVTAGKIKGMQSAPSQDSSGNSTTEGPIILNDGTMNIDTVISSKGTTLGTSFQNNGTLIANHLIGVGAGVLEGFSNANIMKIGTVDLKGNLYNHKDSLTVTGKARIQYFTHETGTSSLQDLYVFYFYGGFFFENGSRTVTVNRLVATQGYTNYGVTVKAKIIYSLDFVQWFSNMYIGTYGPGTTIVTDSINYCQTRSASGISLGVGNITGTYQKKCIPTCSGSTPIWNGESCEGCPTIRPNWNAEYGICE